jgi:diguanylate cyclase (GGDEF)-like protein
MDATRFRPDVPALLGRRRVTRGAALGLAAVVILLAGAAVVSARASAAAPLEAAITVAAPVALAAGLLLVGFLAWLLAGAAAQIRRQAALASQRLLHDGLTGLPNRVLLADRVAQALRLGKRSGSPLALLVIDLDRFKEVNDTLGHVRGDALLRQVAQRVRGALRASDTLARLEGDVFGVLLPETGGPGAKMVAAKLVHALKAPCQLDGVTVVAEVSIGIVHAPTHGEDFETLLRRADVAMGQARERRAGYAIYDPDQDPHDPRRLALMGELRRAIERDELVLHYQPKIDVRSGGLAGVEALVRWEHPQKGLLGPGAFVPVAEQTGLIRPLTRWVLGEALRQCRAWRVAGMDVPVAVNLAVPSLLDPSLPGEVRRLLAESGLEPSRLVLEITETSLMGDPARAGASLEELAGMGVRLAIDDFGTGYSSLAYLKRLPVDEIKIDRTFVSDMTRQPDDAAIVRATIDIARNLGLEVVAEGVETQDVWDELAALGCDLIQGFFAGRPVPAAELETWLAQWRSRTRAPQAASSAGAALGSPPVAVAIRPGGSSSRNGRPRATSRPARATVRRP